MKRFIKSLILSLVLLPMLALPVFASNPADITDPAQQIQLMRTLEVPIAYATIEGRILNLTIELQIHKMKVESDYTFRQRVQGTMIPLEEGAQLSLKARWFESIALASMYGLISDDMAIQQLQNISLLK